VLERPDDKKSWFEDGEISVNGAVPAVLNPGDALVFHSLTLHGSGPNRTDFARRSMIFRYLNKDGMTPEEWTLVDRKLGALRPGWDKLPIFQR
jgi:ectoine hydroxylase-related dioxygenase (phytanoyl-CoA dioxygenase family)